MTVVLAIRCEDGLVLAADSQITDSGRGMSYPAQKLHPLGDKGAWGGSGARGVLTEIETGFRDAAGTIIDAPDIDRAIQAHVVPILRHHYENFIAEVPGEEAAGTPSAYVLVAGYADDEPFIVEVNPNGLVSRYEDIGFHAVGSGAPMAQQAGALLAHFQMMERSLDYGVVGVVRVLDALRTTAPSVGGPIDVCRITTDGTHFLTEDEITEVRELVAHWEQLESKALDKLFK